MTLFTFDSSVKLDDSQKLLLSKHFSKVGSNIMPHQLAVILGLKYSTALIDLLGNNELKSLKQLPRDGFKAFDSESLKPLSRLAFEAF